MARIGLLLVNLGTPDAPDTRSVRRYLTEFLLDPRVIDISWWSRQLLVRGIIAPFRAPKSAAIYRKIWTEEGSPLMVHGQRLRDRLQDLFGEEFDVELAMRYQNPSIEEALGKLRERNPDRIVVLPLFPQYASATTGSIHQRVMELTGQWQNLPDLRLIGDYYDHPALIKAFVAAGSDFDTADYDHVLFSYHGLPERQIRKADRRDRCLREGCCRTIEPGNARCYRAQCLATTRALVEALDLKEGGYTTCFQSRLGRDPWIQPYTSDVLEHLAAKGAKSLLVYCPAFVADCIETIDEIGEEYAEEFKAFGGDHLQLVPGLNDRPEWVEGLAQILRDKLNQEQMTPVNG